MIGPKVSKENSEDKKRENAVSKTVTMIKNDVNGDKIGHDPIIGNLFGCF